MHGPLVTNCIEACAVYDGTERLLDERERTLLVIHRTEAGENAVEVARACSQGPHATVTGKEMPYAFIVARDGGVTQALRVLDVSPHARRWNRPGIGVGVVGDFRRHEPTPEQWHSLLVLGHVFSGWLGGDSAVVGHDELDGASADASKQCPGPLLSMPDLRREIREANLRRVQCVNVAF